MAKPAKKPGRVQSSQGEPRAEKPAPPAPATDPEQPGLVCRGCGCGHFIVFKTRPAPGQSVIRERICRHCGKRLLTRETGF